MFGGSLEVWDDISVKPAVGKLNFLAIDSEILRKLAVRFQLLGTSFGLDKKDSAVVDKDVVVVEGTGDEAFILGDVVKNFEMPLGKNSRMR